MFELTLLNFAVILSFSFFVGMAGSVLGIGGGAFMVPFLVIAYEIPIHNAIAISLVAIVAISSSVASVNVGKGLANMRLGIILEMLMVMGSITGALVLFHLPERIAQIAFGFFLLPVSFLMFYKARRASRKKKEDKYCSAESSEGVLGCIFYDPSISKNVKYAVKNVLPASIVSFFGGSLAGLLGIGGGIVQVPLINLVCGLPIKAATATSNFMIGVSACASALVFFKRGLIINELAGTIVIGVLLGTFAGVRILYKSKSSKIQLAFAILIYFAGIKMLTESF